ncbi:MAG TPA: 3',5'-nucleoside bisphosphate phosphatase [Casimicrobiaceae bacterium]|nr:3',5'-nucleoside bisphosphate phosphatase [Casimicrobiaceae bacterium]
MHRYDLHSHSTYSDGLLTPDALVHRAASRGVDVFALTDHDDTGGLPEAAAAARDARIEFIPGAELSVSWESHTLHILGLNIDAAHPELDAGLASIRSGRDQRARQMAAGLAEAGIPGAYEGARAYVTSERLISRTHFARFLVETGHASETGDVFRRFLTPGKPGYVKHVWATLPDAVRWIHVAGGVAVIAHPGRYKVSPTAMRRLLGEFRDAGGDGIELLSPSHTSAQLAEYSTYARLFGLACSCGSDYHGPGEGWMDLGDLPEMPAGVTPIWSLWQ